MAPALVLHARAVAELMTAGPKSVRQDATVAEGAAFLSARGFSAAPVVDGTGHPVGVVSRTDLLAHQGQRAAHQLGVPGPGPGTGRAEPGNETAVRDVMTPAVFC